MNLKSAPILVVCAEPETAHHLVSEISSADIDVVFAATAVDGLQRLRQFHFAAAIIAWQDGVEHLLPALGEKHVPFFVYGLPPSGASLCGQPLVVADMELVLPTLVNLLSVQ